MGMGTRFRLFAQPPFADAQSEPEIVTVSSPAGSLGDGPSDDMMYVVEPVGKARPYGMNRGPLGTPFIYLPPWHGDVHAPAIPDAEGHFDHYTPGMPGFAAAHIFGCVRFTLDVWEGYIGQPLVWHFRDHADRLEISLLPEWDNAQYGYGFLEAGSQRDELGRPLPFSLDFDVIAHEVGHAIIYAILGVPRIGTEYPEYVGFQESFSDCVSLIAAMHFPSVIGQVLDQTHGNLYRSNRIARFSESSTHSQIRSANNTSTMAEFVNGWTNEHALSQPLTGAIFDILVDIFHESLVERGLITPDVENLADLAEIDPRFAPALQSEFDHAFGGDPDGFCQALLDARDIVGHYLAETLWELGADFLDYGDVARTMLAVDQVETDGRYARILVSNFERRGIGRLHAGRKISSRHRGHLHSDRTLLPVDRIELPRMSYHERYVLMRSNQF
jgi:hypothetical protein